MKTMTCKQLGGACEKEFSASSFEQIVEMSKLHGMEMFQAQDAQHLQALAEIQMKMQNPDAMKEWFDSKKAEYEALSDD